MIDKPNLKNMTKRSKKAPTFKYGLEITKPFSKAMYDHNDQCAQEMRANIIKKWEAEIKELGAINMETPWSLIAEYTHLVQLQKGVMYSGYGDGYTLEMVDKEFRNELETMANWQPHENYSYLCFKGLVPRTTFMMVGFDWEKCDYDGRIVANSELTSDFAEFEGEIEVDWAPNC